jgi:hypothetical protein
MIKKRNRISIFDLFKEEIEYYLKLDLSIRCIYLLLKDKIQKENKLEKNISYQALRNYIAKNFKQNIQETSREHNTQY